MVNRTHLPFLTRRPTLDVSAVQIDNTKRLLGTTNRKRGYQALPRIPPINSNTHTYPTKFGVI